MRWPLYVVLKSSLLAWAKRRWELTRAQILTLISPEILTHSHAFHLTWNKLKCFMSLWESSLIWPLLVIAYRSWWKLSWQSKLITSHPQWFDIGLKWRGQKGPLYLHLGVLCHSHIQTSYILLTINWFFDISLNTWSQGGMVMDLRIILINLFLALNQGCALRNITRSPNVPNYEIQGAQRQMLVTWGTWGPLEHSPVIKAYPDSCLLRPEVPLHGSTPICIKPNKKFSFWLPFHVLNLFPSIFSLHCST